MSAKSGIRSGPIEAVCGFCLEKAQLVRITLVDMIGERQQIFAENARMPGQLLKNHILDTNGAV